MAEADKYKARKEAFEVGIKQVIRKHPRRPRRWQVGAAGGKMAGGGNRANQDRG